MRVPASSRLAPRGLLHRDRRIVELAQAKLAGARVDFTEALRALRDATEEVILGGRVYFLGATDAGPIVGSLVTGVGIVECAGGIELVRVMRSGHRTALGWFSR